MEIKDVKIPLFIFAVYFLIVAVAGTDTLCFFKNIYGIPCPGCGLYRSFICLFKGEIGTAFLYHPLFPLVLISGIVFALRDYSIFRILHLSRWFWLAAATIFIAVWIVRMILLFPDEPPMDFNRNSLFFKIYELVYFL